MARKVHLASHLLWQKHGAWREIFANTQAVSFSTLSQCYFYLGGKRPAITKVSNSPYINYESDGEPSCLTELREELYPPLKYRKQWSEMTNLVLRLDVPLNIWLWKIFHFNVVWAIHQEPDLDGDSLWMGWNRKLIETDTAFHLSTAFTHLLVQKCSCIKLIDITINQTQEYLFL